MAQVQISLISFKLTTNSTDTVRTPLGNYFSVPANNGINSVRLDYVTLDAYGGNTVDAALYLDGTTRAHDNSWLGAGGKDLLTSVFTAGSHYYRFHLKSSNATTNVWELGTVVLTIDYNPPYTKCSAPTSLSLSADNIAPGATSRLSWAGAAPGTGMSIASYNVYRATSVGGTYTYLGNTVNAYLDVAAPTANGAEYFYKVITIGTVAGWESDMSIASAGLTCVFSAPSAPTEVSISMGLVNPSGEATLSWSGATNGTNNAITGYDVYRATSVAGTYTKVGSAAGLSLVVTAPDTQGATYYYKVVAKGTYSDSAQSSVYAALKANTQPGKPTFVFPITGAETYSLAPAIRVTVPAEPDSQLQTLEIKLNSGSWASLGNILAAGETKTYVLEVTDGAHTITVRAKDALGLTSAETAISIVVTAPTWSRTLTTGIVFASALVSGRTDLNELVSAVNKARNFVGLAGVAPAGIGLWARWKPVVEELQVAIKDAYTAGGKASPATDVVPSYPTVSVLNQLRTLLRAA